MENSFSNENIQLLVQKQTGCTLEYTVTCLTPLLQKAEKQAIKKVSKEISLPGFRKGKVPEDVVRKNYKKAVDSEMKEELVQIAFQEARKLETTKTMHIEGSVQIKNVSFDDSGAVLTYAVTTNPEVPNLDALKDIQIEAKPLKAVTEADVKREIKNLLRLFASWDDITDREVREGDFVRINGFDLSTPEESKVFDRARLDVSKDGMATTWLYEALLGMQIGESREVESFPNEDETEEVKAAFEKKKLRLELMKIEQPNMPELDDAFAQKLGLASVEDLETKMREKIENETMSNHMDKLKDSLMAQILKNISIEVPTLLVDRELASRMRRYLSSAAGKKEYEALSKAEQEAKREEIREKSLDAIRLYFIVQGIINEFNLTPPAHMNQALAEIAQKHMKEGGTKRSSQDMMQQAQNEQNQYIAEIMMDVALVHVLDKILHVAPQSV